MNRTSREHVPDRYAVSITDVMAPPEESPRHEERARGIDGAVIVDGPARSSGEWTAARPPPRWESPPLEPGVLKPPMAVVESVSARETGSATPAFVGERGTSRIR